MADYQKASDELVATGLEVVALTAQPRERAEETVGELGLSFPVAYGLQVPGDAERIGAFYDAERGIIQPAAFILRHRSIFQSTYSSGSQGRLWSADALALVRFLQQYEQRSK